RFRTLARPGVSVVRGVFVFFIAQLKNSLPNFNVGLTATEPRLAPRGLGALGESGAELLAPATDRLIRDYNTTLEQQLLNVAQAQAEPEIPRRRAV
ncbi:hypothetical protein HDG40_008074, partial [Paraburkholderia sp. JPY158]|nr:hypothetical protein [Paraburkholderia atlantica]